MKLEKHYNLQNHREKGRRRSDNLMKSQGYKIQTDITNGNVYCIQKTITKNRAIRITNMKQTASLVSCFLA